MTSLADYPRLRKVAEYAEQHVYLSAQRAQREHAYGGPAYRWQHTLRVTQYGIQLAEEEGANVELVAAACLLHDSEWFSDFQDGKEGGDHGRFAAGIIRPFLEETGYSPEAVDNICYAVAVHVDGQAGYEHAHTLEARIVSDADNVDRFGALRLIQYCLTDQGGQLTLGDYQTLIGKLVQRVERLQDYRSRQVMETAAGNRLFDRQLALQIDFFQKLIAEHALTRLPGEGSQV